MENKTNNPQDAVVVAEDENEKKKIPFAEFLQDFPVNTVQVVSDYYEIYGQNNQYLRKLAPQLKLWCRECGGHRRYDGKWDRTSDVENVQYNNDFLVYRCRDCDIGTKTYCLRSIPIDEAGGGGVLKIGEFPEIYIDIPNFLPTLLGGEFPYFVKGLKCEKQGFGVAAFSYYRRVVENQKGRMFEKMADAATRLRMSHEIVDDLIWASKQEQFATAVDKVKDHIPEAFKVNGHNPMKVLHSVLSDGIHDRSDDECLAVAQSVRIVLQDMSQRIKDALRDDVEAKSALSELMNRHSVSRTRALATKGVGST